VTDTPDPPTSSDSSVKAGRILSGRYALIDLIARGGMADVWRARDTLLERQVAVKILHHHLAADDDFVKRFRTEAVAAARLHHRSIVAIFDTCSDGGVEAIVMELIHGHTLRDEIDTHGPLEPAVAVNLGADVADALQASHRAGLIHRDVKPANILLCDDQRVMVTDFGIAKVRDTTDRTQAGTMLGTVKYLSPEQVEGKAVDPRSDVYSLGLVLYEALTGKAPFDADTPAGTALARLHSMPPRLNLVDRNIPLALDNVITRAMARNPEDRYPGAAEFRAALLASRSSPARPQPPADLTTMAPRPIPADATVRQAVGPAGFAPPPAAYPYPYPYPGPAPRPRSKRRWGAAIAAFVLIAAAVIVTVILVTRPATIQQAVGKAVNQPEANDPTPVKLVAAKSFDAEGDNGVENERDLPKLIDGDVNTLWVSEYYRDRKFGGTKTGVGVIVSTDAAAKLGNMTVPSPSKDWSAQVYVSDQKPTKLADWGNVVDTESGISDGATFDLRGTNGQNVLLWITDMGTGPPSPDRSLPGWIQINEIQIAAS
jgi:eukaryotic-like serine/threonine-protein kinase